MIPFCNTGARQTSDRRVVRVTETGKAGEIRVVALDVLRGDTLFNVVHQVGETAIPRRVVDSVRRVRAAEVDARVSPALKSA